MDLMDFFTMPIYVWPSASHTFTHRRRMDTDGLRATRQQSSGEIERDRIQTGEGSICTHLFAAPSPSPLQAGVRTPQPSSVHVGSYSLASQRLGWSQSPTSPRRLAPLIYTSPAGRRPIHFTIQSIRPGRPRRARPHIYATELN